MIRYTEHIDRCPACASREITDNYLISREGFMSLPGCPHARCADCGTVFLNPRPSPQALEEFYASQVMESSIAVRSSAERVLQPERRDYFTAHRVAPLETFLDLAASDIFDVGCGVGAFVRMLKNRHARVAGCDVSRVSVSAGRDILGLSDSEIYEGDIYAIRPGSYHLITLWTVIEHLLEPESYIQHLRDHFLKREGYLLLEFPTVDSMMFDICHDGFFWVMPPYHLTLFSQAGMQAMLKRCGFEVVYEHLMPRNWYFFDSIARRQGMENERVAALKEEMPQFVLEIDKAFDDMAYKLGRSSSRWVLARRKAG
jgi:SAM-dependent methyltransferase